MKESIVFRKASLDDLAEVMSLAITTFTATYESDNDPKDFKKYLDSHFNEELISEQLVNPKVHYYLAFLDKSCIGYFKLNETPFQTETVEGDCIELERIYLLKTHQKRGFGLELITKAKEIAVAKEVDYLWLGVWEKNPIAVAFYRRNGFSIFDTHIFMIGYEKQVDYLMKIDL